MTDVPLWPDQPRKRRMRWPPRCDDCGRKIWAARSLTRWQGLLLGGKCYLKRRGHQQRITIRISFTPPGHIPGQLDLTDQEPA